MSNIVVSPGFDSVCMCVGRGGDDHMTTLRIQFNSIQSLFSTRFIQYLPLYNKFISVL